MLATEVVMDARVSPAYGPAQANHERYSAI
jgi:hypothetical protein